MTNNKKTALLVLISAGILGACGTDTDLNSGDQDSSSSSQEMVSKDQADDTSSETSSSSESSTKQESSNNGNQQKGINNQEFSILLEDAVQIFNDSYPGASIESIHFDDDDDKSYEYDIDGFDDANEYELSINANSGETHDQESEDDDHNDNEALNIDTIISPQEAMDIVLNETGSGHVDEWELDNEDGTPVYEISLEDRDSHDDDDEDIIVHAETGEVLKRD